MHCHVLAGTLDSILLHVNGYIDFKEVEVVAGARDTTREKFLAAVLSEDTPYFETYEDFRAWLKENDIPETTFTNTVVCLW